MMKFYACAIISAGLLAVKEGGHASAAATFTSDPESSNINISEYDNAGYKQEMRIYIYILTFSLTYMYIVYSVCI